jgi:hypothetical protein
MLLLALAGAAALALIASSSPPARAASVDYATAYRLGLSAYRYGLPLIDTNQTFRTQTSVSVATDRGYAPPNQFSRARKLTRASSRTVVAPNHDTLYSIAWLDLRRQPIVLHVPRVRHRYFVIPLMSPYTEDFRNLGTVARTKPGNYVITGPGQGRVRLPPGARRIRSPYSRVWIIARTLVRGRSDVANVRRIEGRYTLTPLSKLGTNWKPPIGRHPDRRPQSFTAPTGLAWFDMLGRLLERFPPPAADRPILRRLAKVGIGPGMEPSRERRLGAAARRGLRRAVVDGPSAVLTDIRADYAAGFAAHNGWLVMPTGRYGTDYTARAATAQIGLGALRPSESIYPFAQVDEDGQPLTGARDYVLHIPAGQLPPVNGFWSLTLYDTSGFFVPNPIHRYLLNDRSDLHRNRDGSIDIYVQRSRPAGPSRVRNWLPAPSGPFRLIFRLYAPRRDRIAGIFDGSGWRPPPIVPTP